LKGVITTEFIGTISNSSTEYCSGFCIHTLYLFNHCWIVVFQIFTDYGENTTGFRRGCFSLPARM